MSLGNKLKQYRVERGYSQEDIANYLKITRQAISKWENDWSIPDIDNLVMLSKLYDVSLDELIKEECIPEEKEKLKCNGDNIPYQHKNEIQQYVWVIMLLTIGCFLGIFGIFITSYVVWYTKNQGYSKKIIYLLCIIAMLICLWNTWNFINIVFIKDAVIEIEKIGKLL